MDKSQEVKALLTSFFEQVSTDHLEKARAVTGIGYLPRGTLERLIADQDYSVGELVTLLLAETLVQQEERKNQAQRIEELEAVCAHQRAAIDDIAHQSFKLRAVIAQLDPNHEQPSSLDLLKDIAMRPKTGGA